MSAKSKIGFDFVLESSSTENGSYTEVCALRNLQLPGFERVIIRVDELHDEWEKILAGKKKIGDLKAEAVLTETNYSTIFTTHFDRDPGDDLLWYRIAWAEETGHNTPTRVKFAGVLKMIDPSELQAETTSAATIPFTIQGSGEPTLSAHT